MDDINFQGCEAETDQPRIRQWIHWQVTEDNTDSLLQQCTSDLRRFNHARWISVILLVVVVLR